LLEQKNLQGNNMSYINNGVFNHQKWQRDMLSEGPGNDPMLKSLRTRVPGEKFPDLNTWWEYEPEDIMTYVYWHQGQLPPTGPKFEKEWLSIVKQLHTKYPIPADVLPSVDLDKNAMDAIMHDVPRAENIDRATMTEALARGLKPLLMIGSKVGWNTMSEDALLDLSDKFEKIDDEDADSIASHLNMSIELRQDGDRGAATKMMKQFNKVCKDALRGKPIKSAFEGVSENTTEGPRYKKYVTKAFKDINDAMFNFRHAMGIKQLTNKDMKLKKKVDSLHQGIFDLQKEMKIKGLTEIESEDNTEFTVKLSHLLDKHVSKGGEIDESLPKFKTPYEAYSWIMNKRGEAMDIEMEMMETSKEIQMAYGEMEQDAEPGGGPKADRYGREIEALENQHKELRAEFNMVMAEIDEYDQNY